MGLTNWRSETATRELSFADKLGLSAGSRYIAFDYCGQKLFGVFKDRMKVEIDPHDTRIFLLHPVLNRPQLVGTSRHITGAYSIEDLAWDSSKKRLRGASETVPGDSYTLWFYVPEGVTVAQVRAESQGKREIAARAALEHLEADRVPILFGGPECSISSVNSGDDGGIFGGGTDKQILSYGSFDDVQHYAERQKTALAPGGGYVFAP